MTRTVLYVEASPARGAGGSHFSLLQLVRGLDRGRYRPVVAFTTDNPLVPEFRAAGAEVHVAPAQPPSASRAGGGELLRGELVREEQRQLALVLRVARRVKPDLLHFNDGITPNRAGLVGACLLRRPSVCHERKIRSYSRLDRALAGCADRVIAISGSVRDALVEQSVVPSRVVQIYNAVDPDTARPASAPADVRRRLGLCGDGPLVGIVGRLVAWKGQDVVVRALARLRDEFPGLQCLVIGEAPQSGRAYEGELRRLVSELGLEGRVHFTGFVNPVTDVVQILDVVVHASTAPEPFGRVLLDAMSLSRPVVASDAGGPREIVEPGRTGLLVPPGDPAALAAALRTLLGDPALAQALGRAGRARLEREFVIGTHVRKVQEVYRSLGVG